MYKNMFKRAALSVRRKLTRTIIVALTFFVISNLILAAIIIKSAVREATDTAKSNLETTVVLQPDMAKLREAFSQNPPTNQAEKPDKSFTRPAVDKSVADKIALSDFVKDYSYALTTSADAGDASLTAVESTNAMPMRGGKMGGDAAASGAFTLSAANAYAYLDGVSSGQITLSSGDYFDESSADAVLLSVDLAEANNLKVGDKIKLKNVHTSKIYTLTILGLYENSSNFQNANQIFLNVATAAKFLSADSATNDDYAIENPTFILQNPDQTSEFIAWINSEFPELTENNIVAKEDTALYDQMVGPIENVGSFASLIQILAFLAGAAIIALIVVIDVKSRRYEMGVLLSLGAKKLSIIGQIFTELTLVSLIAFVLSSCTATVFAQNLSQGLLKSAQTSAEVAKENNFGRGGTGSNRPAGFAGQTPDQMPSQSPDQKSGQAPESPATISELNLGARPTALLTLFTIELLLITLALALPAASILRYQPKQILQGKE